MQDRDVVVVRIHISIDIPDSNSGFFSEFFVGVDQSETTKEWIESTYDETAQYYRDAINKFFGGLESERKEALRGIVKQDGPVG